MSKATLLLPVLQRSRPIDATGLFWSLVLLFGGLFYSQIWPVIAAVCVFASFTSFIWQFKKWKSDRAVQRQATAWCQKHYASHGNSPVVDLIVAIAHDTGCNLNQLTPTTSLDELNWIADGTEFYRGSGHIHRHQVWLADVVREARIPNIDMSSFYGVNLHDAVLFVITPTKDCVTAVE
jgi:hypothetical protein